MKKALIVTLFGDYNYGNKLQNFALKTFLEEMDIEVHTARVDYKYRSFFMNLKSFVKKNLDYIMLSRNKKSRLNKFINFDKKYLCVTKRKYSTYAKADSIPDYYDYIIYGSDQIWNPTCFGNSNLFMGKCAKKTKNIAYAGSFGVAELPRELIKDYSIGFKNFSFISCRESEGVKIIQNLGFSSMLALDPTLLVSESVWVSLRNRSDIVLPTMYVLKLFLGELEDEDSSKIDCFANSNHYQIINPFDARSTYFDMGPEDFLALISNAKMIFTDSFHAAVFSFIFDKSFLVFQRKGVENMNSRLVTFINQFGLEHRFFEGDICEDSVVHNYLDSFSILEVKRKECRCALKEALRKSDQNRYEKQE